VIIEKWKIILIRKCQEKKVKDYAYKCYGALSPTPLARIAENILA
jgi:hypothetical protein